jgi:hypothetical protein
MDDTQMETLVRKAAPQTTTPVGLAAHRSRILADARRRGRGRAGVWAGGLAAFALIVGGGSVAAASGGMETPWGWVADNVFSFEQADGSVCFQGMKLALGDVPEDSEAAREARAIVGGIDLATLDIAAAETWVRDQEGIETVSEGTIHQLAVHKAASDVLFAELAARGLDTPDDSQEIGLLSSITACN